MSYSESDTKAMRENFIPVLNGCFSDLNKIINTGDANCNGYSVKQFVCKLKYLENELVTISSNFDKTKVENQALHNELERERLRNRKKSIKIKELETQLNNTEFKLKVRLNNETKKEVAVISKDVAIQHNSLVDKPKEFTLIMKNLRETAQNTLNIIKNMTEPENDDFNDENPNEQKAIKEVFQETIDTLKQKNKVWNHKNNEIGDNETNKTDSVHNNESNKLIPLFSYCNAEDSTSLSDSSFSGVLTNDSDDDVANSRWKDPNFPRNLVKTMQRRAKKLKKQQKAEESVGCLQIERIFTEFNERNNRIQQKIDCYFDR